MRDQIAREKNRDQDARLDAIEARLADAEAGLAGLLGAEASDVIDLRARVEALELSDLPPPPPERQWRTIYDAPRIANWDAKLVDAPGASITDQPDGSIRFHMPSPGERCELQIHRPEHGAMDSPNLRAADLGRANLGGANPRDAYLGRAYLRDADLRGAEGIHPARVTDLRILLDQVGKIRAYKLVNARGEGPFNGGVRYEVGETVICEDADTDPDRQCGAGINLATLPWCLANWRQGYRVLLCEFTARDIAVIPTATDGKFRVAKCKVIREVDLEPIFAAEREEAQ